MSVKANFLLAHWNVFVAAILVAGLVWIAFSRVESDLIPSLAVAPRQGFIAPDFSLPDANGETITLSALEGQVVLVNFWASWCPPCRVEMPAIEAVYQDYRQKGVIVLAINATAQDDAQSALNFVRSNGLSFPILFDGDGSVYARYQISALPTSFFIGRDGKIGEVVVGGPMAEALLRARLETLLQEGR